jgi:replicative DNA helicase
MNSFEQILLKKLIYSGEFFTKVVPIIKPNHFTSQGCSKIYTLLHQYYYTYKQIPTITELVAQVKNVPNMELRKAIVDELKEVSKIELVENTEFMINETVDFVKNAIFTEALIIGSDAISEKDENKILKSKELMEEMSKISIDSDLGLDFDDIEKMIEYYQNKLVGVLTQHLALNKRIGTGFLPGTLSIIMAASGIGKSLLMTDLVSGNIKEGKNVLLVSMEMEDKEIMKRVHANALNLPINKLTSISPDTIRIAHEKFTKENTLGKFFIKDYPTGTFSPLMLDGLLDNYKTELGIEFDIIYLDYLGIMKSDLITAQAGLYSYIKSIVEETRSIAKKHRIPIISASQLNRCLEENVAISTVNGTTPIKNIKVGDELLNDKKVVEVMKTGVQKVFKIKTKNGKELICSENHKIPTSNGTMTLKVGLEVGSKVHTK